MRIFYFTIFYLSIIFAQSATYDLHPSVIVQLNSRIINITNTEREKLLNKVEKADINYTIVGMEFETTHSMAKILVPQTFDTTALMEQCLLYFIFLGSEESREKETLMVYPYFEPVESQASVIVTYSGGGRYKIMIKKWETIPMPKSPSSLEAELFNMVLDQSFSSSQNIESIPDEVFDKVARINNIETSVVKEIYQRVLLWQKSQ